MEHDYPNRFAIFTRANNTSWQSQLRCSVRLYLAMGEHPVQAQELEAHLRRTEDELVHYLLEGEPPTTATLKQAQTVLDMAQSALLASEPEVQTLLRELTAEQATKLWAPEFTPAAEPGE
ncbi:hypothetical protein GO988_01030 [Hymenobacter sp. HMF4947]|uniref:Uncharacterized protein n=1 Tax=Hymenobacter ginkgonis TaxID=2682976 RepID=A0A7K1T9C8_9BACT|nr:hypothetical protein [Hymenobacter ginkgonis]MVN74902.1 hypothetical protein [Hymenobacter ginkgonis]